MPSRTNTTTTTTTKPVGTVTSKRFELPALEFKFGSLTDGTDIPPPLPSPVEQEAVPTPPDTPNDDTKQPEGPNTTNGHPDAASPRSQLSNTSKGGTKRPAEDNPASPTLSARPGSIRRLFSRSLLNAAHTDEAPSGSSPDGGRPPSRGGSSVADSRKAKRSSRWFGRLLLSDGGDAAKPASSGGGSPLSPPATQDEKTKPAGPPPPMIPELSELKSKLGIQSEGGFGDDLFKDIK
ncbi:hypothetical protein VTK56DRAFT_2144 [Thermocarpiscus australiensis]